MVKNMAKNQLTMVDGVQTDKIARKLLVWLNEYADKPAAIAYEFLPSDQPGMALSIIQGAYKLREYMRGAYVGQMQFKIIYRLQPGSSNNSRLTADETLNALADWAIARDTPPDIGNGRVTDITCTARAALFGRYEDGSEDHQVLMAMEYYWPG